MPTSSGATRSTTRSPVCSNSSALSIVAIVFLQMANTLRENRHVSNDVFILLIEKARPRLAAGLHAVFNVIGAALMAMIVVYVWPIVREAYEGHYYAGTAGVVEIPTWPFMPRSSSSARRPRRFNFCWTHGANCCAPAGPHRRDR